MERVGWIGVGVMGSRMLPHLTRAGYPTVLYARNQDAAGPIFQRGSEAAASPAEVASRSDLVFSIVSNPTDVAEIYLGADGLLAGAHSGCTLIDMTTSSPELAQQIAQLAHEISVHAVDAPVSGGPLGAEAATLSIMLGGDSTAVERVLPVLRHLGATIVHHGGPGAGQSAKLANQIALGGAMLGICEAFLFARENGLQSGAVLETLSGGVAGSELMRYIWRRLDALDLEPGFRIEHLIKDLDLALDASHHQSLGLPGTALVRELCEQARAAGQVGKGSQALITALDRKWDQRHPI